MTATADRPEAAVATNTSCAAGETEESPAPVQEDRVLELKKCEEDIFGIGRALYQFTEIVEDMASSQQFLPIKLTYLSSELKDLAACVMKLYTFPNIANVLGRLSGTVVHNGKTATWSVHLSTFLNGITSHLSRATKADLFTVYYLLEIGRAVTDHFFYLFLSTLKGEPGLTSIMRNTLDTFTCVTKAIEDVHVASKKTNVPDQADPEASESVPGDVSDQAEVKGSETVSGNVPDQVKPKSSEIVPGDVPDQAKPIASAGLAMLDVLRTVRIREKIVVAELEKTLIFHNPNTYSGGNNFPLYTGFPPEGQYALYFNDEHICDSVVDKNNRAEFILPKGRSYGPCWVRIEMKNETDEQYIYSPDSGRFCFPEYKTCCPWNGTKVLKPQHCYRLQSGLKNAVMLRNGDFPFTVTRAGSRFIEKSECVDGMHTLKFNDISNKLLARIDDASQQTSSSDPWESFALVELTTPEGTRFLPKRLEMTEVYMD